MHQKRDSHLGSLQMWRHHRAVQRFQKPLWAAGLERADRQPSCVAVSTGAVQEPADNLPFSTAEAVKFGATI